MKFREYVGEEKANEVKRIVKTKIGNTEADFLKRVARENTDGTKIRPIETYLEFGIKKSHLKRVFDYIRSWFIRYKIPFNSVNPYLTLYLLNNLPSVSVVMDAVKKTKNNSIIYKPKGTITIISSDEKNYPRTHIEGDPKKDYVILDYFPNKKYNKVLEDIFHSMNIDIIYNQCYVKLFEIEKGEGRHKMYEDMMYSIPKIPNLNLGGIGLKRRI